jgi:hypothetical protein
MAAKVFSLILGPVKIGPPREILFRYLYAEFKSAKIFCLP